MEGPHYHRIHPGIPLHESKGETLKCTLFQRDTYIIIHLNIFVFRNMTSFGNW